MKIEEIKEIARSRNLSSPDLMSNYCPSYFGYVKDRYDCSQHETEQDMCLKCWLMAEKEKTEKTEGEK